MPRLPDEVRRALQRLQGGVAPDVPRPGVTARQQINLEELRGRIAGGVEKSFQEAKIREAQEQRAAEFRPSLASGLDRPIQVVDPSEQEYGQPPGWLTPITDKVADWVGSGAEQVVDWAEPVTKRLAGPMKDILESAPFNQEVGRMGLDALRTLGVAAQYIGLPIGTMQSIQNPIGSYITERAVGGPGQIPFQIPSPGRIPGALQAAAGALTEETEGDALTRTQNAIEAYHDAMKAGWGYWFASEMAAGAAAAPGLAGAGRGVVGVATRPGLMETVQPLTRLVPKAARPTVERAIRPGLRGLGETLQLPLKAETAIGRAMVAPFRPLVDPVRGAVKRLRGRPGEEVLSVPTEDVPGIDDILGPIPEGVPFQGMGVPRGGFVPVRGAEGASVYLDDAIMSSGRKIVMVRLGDGSFQPFYRRTGGGGLADVGAQPGDWAPFDGLAIQNSPLGRPGWLNKGAYTGSSKSDPLRRWGTERNRRIGEALKEMEGDFAPARLIKDDSAVNKWLGVSDDYLEQGPGIGKGPPEVPTTTTAVPGPGTGARAAGGRNIQDTIDELNRIGVEADEHYARAIEKQKEYGGGVNLDEMANPIQQEGFRAAIPKIMGKLVRGQELTPDELFVWNKYKQQLAEPLNPQEILRKQQIDIVEEAQAFAARRTTTAGPVTTAEMEAAQAGTMVQGPRAKLEILRERLKQAEDAVSALEARQPYSRKLPTAAPAPAAPGPGTGARAVGEAAEGAVEATAKGAREGGTVYHAGREVVRPEDMRKGVIFHTGTEKAALDRVAIPSTEGQTTVINTYTVRPKKPFLPNGKLLDERLPDDRTYLSLLQNMPRLSDLTRRSGWISRNEIIEQGYDVIPYINVIEDPGSVSYMVLNPNALTVSVLPRTGRTGYGGAGFIATPATAAPGPAPSRVAGEVDLTRRLQDQIDLNEAEWFAESNILERRGLAESLGLSRPKSRIETFDEQLAAAREAERTARAALTTQETFARGRFAKEATTEYRRDVGLREEPLSPLMSRPYSAWAPPITGAPKVGAPGAGGNTQRLPINATSKAEVQDNVAREAFDAVEGSPTDQAATAYWRTGNFDDLINNMGPPDNAFPVLPGFSRAPLKEPSRSSASLSDPTRLIQDIDKGAFGEALQRAVLWPTRRTLLASLNFGDITKAKFHEILSRHDMLGFRAKKLRESAGDVLEHISSADVGAQAAVLMNRPAIRSLLTGVKPIDRARVVGFAQDTRRFFDDVLVLQNRARVARGQDPIPYIENYRPWVRDTNIWARVGFADQPVKNIAQTPPMPDFIKPSGPFVPHAQARKGGLANYEKIRDLQKLGLDYVDSASKDIFTTNIVQNAKVHIKQMRSRVGPDGNPSHLNAADAVESWIMEGFAGQLPGITKALRTFPKLQKGLFGIRRNLSRAVFAGNWQWNLFVQPNSLGLTIHRYGLIDTIRGLSYLIRPSVRREVRAKAYSIIIKGRRGGKAAYQDIGTGIEKTARFERSPIETVEDFANTLTTLIEDNLTGISIRAAYHSGRRQGLQGRALWEFASEGGSKTQSMYNIQDLPGLLRVKEVGSIAPFQTFSFEVMNTVRELNLPLLRMAVKPTGTYITTQNRLLALARWTASIVAFSVLADKAINRKPWQLSSFIPFWGVMTGGVNAGNAWNMALPLKYSADASNAISAFMKYGNWDKLRTWAIQYHMIAGTQINKTLRGIEAVAEGKVTDVAGDTLFETEPPEGWMSGPGGTPGWEAWKAITQGPYAVAEGREYIENLQKGPVSEFFGIDFGRYGEDEEDTMHRAVRQYTLMIDGKETTYSDLPKHPSVREAVKRAVSPGLRDSVDEYIDANFSKRRELAMASDFINIREALSKQSNEGGKLYRLRGDFADGAPVVWKLAKARLNQSFPNSGIFKERIREQLEAGKEFPEIDYSDWTFK